MPDSAPLSIRPILLALIAGFVLAGLTFWGGWVTAASTVLAQPAFALAISWGSRTRLFPQGVGGFIKDDFIPLLMLWLMGFAFVAALFVWPLQMLIRDGSLGAAVLLSASTGISLIVLWRTWPLWKTIECHSGTLIRQWREMAEWEDRGWHGLGVAASAVMVIGIGLCLAWPGVWQDSVRVLGVWVYAAALPLLHWSMQRVTPAETKPIGKPVPKTTQKKKQKPAIAEAPQAILNMLQKEELPDVKQNGELYEAARTGNVEQAIDLINAGASPYTLPPSGGRDQRSLIALAAVLPDLRLLRFLISKGVDLNHIQAGMTPLLAATRDSWHGRPEAVTTLLTNGANPHLTDHEGNTALHHAARTSDPTIAALLHSAEAELDAVNQEGLTALGIACSVSNWRVVEFLLENGAKPEPAGGQAALLIAAAIQDDDVTGVQLLLKHNAQVDVRDAQGRSALHEAAQCGHTNIVSALLAADARVDARDNTGLTPWLVAAGSGSVAVIEALAVAGANINATDSHGCHALLIASSSELVSSSVIACLLELGLDPEQRGIDGRRAADSAAIAGHWLLIPMLDPRYQLPSTVSTGEGKQTPPDQAPLGLLREALERGERAGLAPLVRLCSPEDLGSLLHSPALLSNAEAVAWLLRHGASGEVPDGRGDTPLLASLARGRAGVAVARVLLDAGFSPSGRAGLARFLSACARLTARDDAGLQKLALELLTRGADPFFCTLRGDYPLTLAVRLHWEELVDALLVLGIDRELRDMQGMTALYWATSLGDIPMVRRLVIAGASPEARAIDGRTPLGVALSNGQRELVHWLKWSVWQLPLRAFRESDLAHAAAAGDVDAVRRLLELFDVNAKDEQGCTALLRAAGSGHESVVALLLKHNADPQVSALTGTTPLSAAVSMHQTNIAAMLLKAGADIEYRLPGEVSVLMLAATLGFPDVTARLLAAGADVHAVDDRGFTALHCAAQFGFTTNDQTRLLALLDVLLLSDAVPDGVDDKATTPLLLLLGASAEPGVMRNEDVILAGLECFIGENAKLDALDADGFGPLHLAALHGLMRVAQRLLRAGADPELRDKLDRTPRDIALMQGMLDVADVLTPSILPEADMRATRFPNSSN